MSSSFDRGKLEWRLTRSARSWLLLLIPLAAALVMRALLAFSVHYLEYDEAIHIDVARNIVRPALGSISQFRCNSNARAYTSVFIPSAGVQRLFSDR